VDKLQEMTNGEKLMAGGGILLFIFSWFKWFEQCFDFGFGIGERCATHHGWDNFLSLLGVLIALALAVVVVLRRFGVANMPDKLGNLAWGQVYMIAGIVVFALILLQTLIGDDDADRTIFLWLSLLLSAAVGAGGYLSMQEERGKSTI
jgi:hypothetical protein